MPSIDAANALLRDQKPKEALAIYEKIVKKTPDDELGYCGVIFSLLALDRPKDALAYIKKLTRLIPDEAYPHGAMGVAMEMAGREKEALAHYGKMLKIDPDNIVACIRKATILYKAGRHKESRECIDECINSDMPKGYADMSKIFSEKIDELMDVIKSGIKDSPNYAMPVLDEMVDILFGEGQEPESSIEVAQLMHRADHLAGEGKHKEAAEILDEVIKDHPDDANVHSLKGMQLVEAGMHKEAIACVDEVLRIKPDAADDLGVKAMLLERVGSRDEALACYDRLIEVHPGETAAYHLKCSLLAEAGDAEGVAECYREALESKPSDREGAAAKKEMRAEYRELERCVKAAGSMEAGLARFMKKGGVERQPIWGRGPDKKSRRQVVKNPGRPGPHATQSRRTGPATG